jgi:NitT/TauT family transport system ATP-binding protein/nitrate/nitrite transport system substrate-binding protein
MTAHFRLGLLRLTDSAPVLLAQAAGLFAEEGVAVDISIEPSWANIADKLSFGALDAAVILPPLAIAIVAGLRGARRRLILPMSLSSGGNTVTLAAPLVQRIGRAGSALDRARRLKAVLAEIAPPRLAVVHGFSTHNLLLRYWLAAGGIDPDRDVEILTLPPEATADALAAGEIDGFCAGAPWGAVAEASGAGARLVGTAEIWGAHPEKALAVDAALAEAQPAAVRALLRALLRAALLCDDPAGDSRLVALLTASDGLALPEAAMRAVLAGPDRPAFAADAAGYPFLSHAAWFAGQMRRWGWMEGETPALYRPDLFTEAAHDLGLPIPHAAAKAEGAHPEVWHLPAAPVGLDMRPDTFCDGLTFDEEGKGLPVL